jgi:prepilin peptidase CpaA
MTPLAKGLLAAVVLLAAAWDLRTRTIPNWLTLPALAAGLLVQSPLEAAQGAGLALLVHVPLYTLRAVGGGDLKLMAAVGAFTGPAAWMTIFVFSALLGGAAAIVLALAKGRLRRTLANAAHILRAGLSREAPHRGRPELDIANEGALTLPRGAIIAAATLLYLAAG